MIGFMQWVLGQFVSGWDLTAVVLRWAVDNPVAALFWAGVWASIINYIVWLTPTKIDDSLWTAIKRAIQEGLDNVDRVKSTSKK